MKTKNGLIPFLKWFQDKKQFYFNLCFNNKNKSSESLNFVIKFYQDEISLKLEELYMQFIRIKDNTQIKFL